MPPFANITQFIMQTGAFFFNKLINYIPNEAD